MSRYIAPNMEPEVVLKCGHITGNEFAFKHIGQSGEYQVCPRGCEGDGRYGTVKILRRATVYELIQWHDSGKSAPKRKTRKSPDWLSAMPSQPRAETNPESGRESGRLF